MNTTGEYWPRIREALSGAAHRTAALLRRTLDPAALGTGTWTAAETGAHLAFTLAADLTATGGRVPDLSPHLLSQAIGIARATDVAELNAATLESDPERDLGSLSARIEDRAAAFLEHTAEAMGDEPVTWLGGVKLPVSAVAGHWIGEALIHSQDIAGGSGLPWTMEPAWAELAFTRFLVPMLEASDPRAFVDQHRADGKKTRVEIRVRGAEPVLIVLDDGALRVERSSTTRASCYVAADAPTNFLLSWGRIDPLRAAATGRLRVWGSKPWKALQLARALRMP